MMCVCTGKIKFERNCPYYGTGKPKIFNIQQRQISVSVVYLDYNLFQSTQAYIL